MAQKHSPPLVTLLFPVTCPKESGDPHVELSHTSTSRALYSPIVSEKRKVSCDAEIAGLVTAMNLWL